MQNVDLAEEYLNDVCKIEDMPDKQPQNNPWSVERLFIEYMENFRQPMQITRQIKGPIGQVKLIETLNDHYKDYTFKPKISNMSKEIEKKKRMAARQHLVSFTNV